MGLLSDKNKKILYTKITEILKYLKISDSDFSSVTENKDELYKFWKWLKQKDFYRRKKLSFHLFGLLLYQIRTMPDNSKTEHLLFGLIPIYEYKCRQKNIVR